MSLVKFKKETILLIYHFINEDSRAKYMGVALFSQFLILNSCFPADYVKFVKIKL